MDYFPDLLDPLLLWKVGKHLHLISLPISLFPRALFLGLFLVQNSLHEIQPLGDALCGFPEVVVLYFEGSDFLDKLGFDGLVIGVGLET